MLIWWKVVSLANEVDELKYERASSDDTLSSVDESSKEQERSKRIREEAGPDNSENAHLGKKLLPTMFSRTAMQCNEPADQHIAGLRRSSNQLTRQ